MFRTLQQTNAQYLFFSNTHETLKSSITYSAINNVTQILVSRTVPVIPLVLTSIQFSIYARQNCPCLHIELHDRSHAEAVNLMTYCYFTHSKYYEAQNNNIQLKKESQIGCKIKSNLTMNSFQHFLNTNLVCHTFRTRVFLKSSFPCHSNN